MWRDKSFIAILLRNVKVSSKLVIFVMGVIGVVIYSGVGLVFLLVG